MLQSAGGVPEGVTQVRATYARSSMLIRGLDDADLERDEQPGRPAATWVARLVDDELATPRTMLG